MRSIRTEARFGVIAVALALAMLPVARADFETGMSYLRSGKYLEAAGQFQTLVDENPEYTDGYHLLGVCFLQSRKYADAEKNFLEAISLDGDKFEYHFNLAKTYQAQKKYDKQVGTLNNAEGLASTNKQKQLLFHARGNALAVQEKWDEAVDDLERSLALEPDGATQTQLGKAFFMLGDQQGAVTAMRKAIKLSPSADAYELLVESLIDLAAKASGAAAQSKYRETLVEAERFLEFDSSSFDARYLVGRAALGAGEFDKAIASFQEVLRKKPNHCRAMTNMGTAYQAKSDWTNALAALENATSCDPKLNLAWQTKGFVVQKTASETKDLNEQIKKYEEAIAAYKRALALKPSGSIEKKIRICQKNIEVARENLGMDAAELANQRAIKEEQERIAEEERKRLEWEQKQEEDD